MQKNCSSCSEPFSVTTLETTFLQDHDLPEPIDCPACRRQKRLLFRNFFHLYHRTCSLTGKKIISMYDTTVPFPVYNIREWWSDQWDGLQYGAPWKDGDSFVERLAMLHKTVPRMAIMNTSSENTDYCNLCFYSRNCYLVHGCVNSEDCMYGHIVWRSKNCFDCLYLYQCEYCAECIDCVQCHSLAYSRDCDNCSSSMFLIHCNSCRDCFGCVGLKSKQYHIFNEPHTKEEYIAKIASLDTGSIATMEMAQERLKELTGRETVKYYHGYSSENVTGDYIYSCRNIVEGYDLKGCEDCAHLATCEGFKDSMDCNFSGTASEHSYQSMTIEGYGLIGCHTCLQTNANLISCDNCYSCKECIGCVGLKKKQYCILNHQYTKEEYEELKPKLIAILKREQLWGRFFPSRLSPFGYNETIASYYFPLSKEEVMKRGWAWKEDVEDVSQQYMGPKQSVPDRVQDASDDLSSSIFQCEETGKLFKILPQELGFYRQMNLPLPRRCFDARLRKRFAQRNPRKLWQRNCAQCSKAFQTTYAPERPERVVCEACYLSTVY